MDLTIRRETPEDYREVEVLTREAFWNLYVPGCLEHYVTHVVRDHADFIPELDFVAVTENKIVGSIVYTRAALIDETGRKISIVTFGPLCVLPEVQRQGIGLALVKHTKKLALEMGFKAIVIHGDPHNYCRYGFKSGKDLNIGNMEGKFPYSLLALELEEGVLKDHQWRYLYSDVYNIEEKDAEEFDRQFEPKKKEHQYSQEEFSINCRAFLEENSFDSKPVLQDLLKEFRLDHEPPSVISKLGWRYHHIGIPTTQVKPHEKFIEKYKMYVSGFSSNPFGIEWMRFDPDSPLPELIKTIPHVAFEVYDLEAALQGQEVLFPAGSPSKGVRSAMIVYYGAPVELISFENSENLS
jgi:putative acetyltransferase